MQAEETSSSRDRNKKTTLFDINALSDSNPDGRLQFARRHANPIFLGGSKFTNDEVNAQH